MGRYVCYSCYYICSIINVFVIQIGATELTFEVNTRLRDYDLTGIQTTRCQSSVLSNKSSKKLSSTQFYIFTYTVSINISNKKNTFLFLFCYGFQTINLILDSQRVKKTLLIYFNGIFYSNIIMSIMIIVIELVKVGQRDLVDVIISIQ